MREAVKATILKASSARQAELCVHRLAAQTDARAASLPGIGLSGDHAENGRAIRHRATILEDQALETVIGGSCWTGIMSADQRLVGAPSPV